MALLLSEYSNTVGLVSEEVENVSPIVVETLDNRIEEVIELSVYPNPTSEMLNIKGLNGQTYDVYNMSGQKVIKATSKEVLDLSALQSGTYLIRTVEGQITRFYKI